MSDQKEMGHPPQAHDEEYALRQLSSAQTLITIALISAPVSLVVGGILLSIVSVICAFVARSKIGHALSRLSDPGFAALRLRSQVHVALIISLAVTGINVAYLVYIIPAIIEVMQTGDMQQLMGTWDFTPGSETSGSTSVWD